MNEIAHNLPLIPGVFGIFQNKQKHKTGLEIATHWSPMRLKIRCWRPDIENWSPVGDPPFFRGPFNLKGKRHLLEDETHFIRIDIINQTHDSPITNWIHHVFDSAASLF